MITLNCDFSNPVGPVKPMHGVNNGPIASYYNFDNFHYLTEAGIPFSRLHDTGGTFGGARFVDIWNIFTDKDADENDPASYDFTFTDLLITNLVNAGVEPFYRLGTTIENGHHIKAYHIYPPKDYEKFARICANIVRHYNYGWADGFHYNIKYWEIWNEPDNSDVIEENPCWKGTKEQFFELYRVVSNHLRQEFPDIKIGGYASCGFYACMSGEASAEEIKNANVSPRYKYFVTFFNEFMDYINDPETKSPMDFFTWHTYSAGPRAFIQAEYVRKQLDSRGMNHVESILNEWNPQFMRHGNAEHMVDIAHVMVLLHRYVDQLDFYTADYMSYGALFDYYTRKPTKAYYVFPAFNELYKLGQAVDVKTGNVNCPALGATDGTASAIMFVNATYEVQEVSLAGTPFKGAKGIMLINDSDHTAETVECEFKEGIELGPKSVVVIKTV